MIPNARKAPALYTSSDFQMDCVWTDKTTGAALDWTGLTVTASLVDGGNSVILSKVSGDANFTLASGGVSSLRFTAAETATVSPQGSYQLAYHVANTGGALDLAEAFNLTVVDSAK